MSPVLSSAAIADIDRVIAEVTTKEATTARFFTDTSVRAHAKYLHMMRACLEKWAPRNSTVRDPIPPEIERMVLFDVLLGRLEALKENYAADRLAEFEALVHGELFCNYLDMASHLQQEGYKDAAAVIAGSTLEAHLRELATRHAVPTTASNGKPKKATVLNDDLKAAGVYNEAERKAVAAWQAIRNDAAHGDYDKYDHKQVRWLIDTVTDFIGRHPA